jgi:hypothetical protein
MGPDPTPKSRAILMFERRVNGSDTVINGSKFGLGTKPKCRRAPQISGSGGTADLEPRHHRRFVLRRITQDAGARVSEEPEGTLLPIAPRSSTRRDMINHVAVDWRHW